MNKIELINIIINVTWNSKDGFRNLIEVTYKVNDQTLKKMTLNPSTINNTVFQIKELDGRGGFVAGTITFTTSNDSLPIDVLVSYNNQGGSNINERYQLRKDFNNGSHLHRV